MRQRWRMAARQQYYSWRQILAWQLIVKITTCYRVKDSPVVPPKQDYVQQGQESRRPPIGELIRRKSNDVMVFTRNHKNRLGAAALGFILSAGSIGVSNIYEAQNNTVEQKARTAPSGGAGLRSLTAKYDYRLGLAWFFPFSLIQYHKSKLN